MRAQVAAAQPLVAAGAPPREVVFEEVVRLEGDFLVLSVVRVASKHLEVTGGFVQNGSTEEQSSIIMVL